METSPVIAATSTQQARATISVIVPVYNNAPTLEALAHRVRSALGPLGCHYELILVNDASPDFAGEVISKLAREDRAIRSIQLSHNLGQQGAVLAGLRQSCGDWVVVLDADLQDPPEAIPALLERAKSGYAAVFAGRSNSYQSAGRMITSRFYKLVQHALCDVPLDAGMYIAMSRAAVGALLSFENKEGLSLVAMVGLSGLSSTSIPVARAVRPIGASSYSHGRRLAVAMRQLARAAKWRWRRRGLAISRR